MKLKAIVHATDFSEHSKYAFELACALARDHEAKLYIIHVKIPEPMIYGEGMINLPEEGFDESLKRRLEEIVPAHGSIEVERALLAGNPVTEIVNFAKKVDADLIVMGTHGWTGLSRIIMGSVAENVVRKAHCPVLTVKHPVKLQELATAGEKERPAGSKTE
ncbi:MAG: universal stress protein [Gemmatales bacterium]|nr:MAG: universal stress protein [Gemmatales bacterium]